MDPLELPRWWNDCEGEQMPGFTSSQPEEGVFVTPPRSLCIKF